MFEEVIGELIYDSSTEKKLENLKALEDKRRTARLELEKCRPGTPHYIDTEKWISNLTKKIKKSRRELGSDL